ncbi:MAG: hypothetical protein EOP48_19910 [Sphingobacteriales bacterium]|nr:MAG: hypothetical protein EOP48_19910 [Sphingobacteriales bacterium]
MKNPSRVCIYTSDVQRITGKTYRQSRLILVRIKKHLNKQDHHLISVTEFCSYTGLSIVEVMQCIIG